MFRMPATVKTIRDFGKIRFIELVSPIGKVKQLVFKKNVCPEGFDVRTGDRLWLESYSDYTTKSGEPSLLVQEFAYCSRCTTNFQVGKTYDDKTVNQKSDERHLYTHEQLIFNPEEKLRVLNRREALISNLKFRLWKHFYAMEVETPILGLDYGGAVATPFQTDGKFLRISPEIELKKLCTGLGRSVFEIGKCFRNEGKDKTHSPEFTLLEAYILKNSVPELPRDISIDSILNDFLAPNLLIDLKFISYKDCNEEKDVPEEGVWVVNEIPADLSPFCKEVDGIALRYVVFWNGLEIAEIYDEETDPKRIASLFPDRPDFISAAEYGIPDMIGFGIGIDRLLMAKYGLPRIEDSMTYEFGKR